jgi:hypothetical protein
MRFVWTNSNAGATTLSLDRTYELLAKWQGMGLIEKKIILHGDKLWIWCSRVGLRTVELPFTYGDGAPASVRLPHLYAINQVRLVVEDKRPHDLWTSERQLRKQTPASAKGEHQPHTPDATLTNAVNGKVSALEIERHAKTEDELAEILRELAVSYTSVWYFATSATRRQIEGVLATFPPAMQKPFVLYDLADYTGGTYGIA